MENHKLMDLNTGTSFFLDGEEYRLLSFNHNSEANPGRARCCTNAEYLEKGIGGKRPRYTYIDLTEQVKVKE